MMKIYEIPSDLILDGERDCEDILTPDGRIFSLPRGQIDLSSDREGYADVAMSEESPCVLYPAELRFVSEEDRDNYTKNLPVSERVKYAYEAMGPVARMELFEAEELADSLPQYRDVVTYIDVPKDCFEIVRGADFAKTPLYGKIKMRTPERTYSLNVDLDMVSETDKGYEIAMVDGARMSFYRVSRDEKGRIWNIAVGEIKDFFNEKSRSRKDEGPTK